MNANLTFNNSTIYPDNSTVQWEMDGIGRVDGKVKFLLRTNGRSDDTSCFIQVIDKDYSPRPRFNGDCDYGVMSPIFWNTLEWYDLYKTNFEQAMKNQYHVARQAAMQWCENFLSK